MGVSLQISWVGRDASDFARTFYVAAQIDNFRPLLNEIAEEVVSPSVSQNFKSGGRPSWPALAPSTLASKARRGHSSRILVATGALEAAASDISNYVITKDELRASPGAIPYWGFHQTGGDNLPQRTIMMLQAQDRTRINTLFAKFVRTFMVFNPNAPGGRVFRGT